MSEAAERALLAASRSGRTDAVCALLVEHYGPELLGFLAAMLRDEEVAREVFAEVCEHWVRDVAGFEGRSSYRTWAYSVARHAALRRLRRRRPVRLETDRMHSLVAPVRSSTQPHRRTENKQRLARIRAALDPRSQALLTLRVDRAMSWNEIAEVLSDGPLGDAELRREAARVRKRFERLKGRLRAAMGEAGPR